MINFKEYLLEARSSAPLNDGPLLHLSHTSELGHKMGEAGTEHALGALGTLYKHAAKGTLPKELSVKVDGAPSVVIDGPNSRNPMGSVGTKATFNANPKINASHEDIDANHGHSLGLSSKLKDVLDSAHKVIPPGMRVQGDVTHGGAKDISIQDIDGVPHATWKSNLMKYAVPVDSEEGQKALNSKVGLALHTVYDETGRARPITQEDMNRIGSHPDVHIMSVFPTNPAAMTPEHAKAINGHLQAAAQHHEALKGPGYAAVTPHGIDLETYINSTIRNGGQQSLGGYMQWLADRGEKKASAVKTAPAQARKRQEAQIQIAHVKKNKKHFENALGLQNAVENATSTMSDALANTHGYRTFIGDQETGPEGHVYNYKGKSVKIIRRRPSEEGKVAFSQANLQKGGFGK